ncbi:tRNA 2-selenouridine(34) synthase MnmH [Bacteroidota bacterium]
MRKEKRVGTSYKQSGRKDAMFMGLEFAGPKMKALALEASKIARSKQLLVHCWRGGMRSSSMAWLFSMVGLECHVLEGGYKTFRKHVLSSIDEDFPFVVIGGLTGSGKTDVLQSLEKNGEQIIDLENLAHHKGSAFGSLGEKSQSSNEQFENDIFWQLNRLDRSGTVWVEDESRSIGKNILPAGVYRNIRSAPVIFLDLPFSDRIDRLVRDYAGFPKEDLIDSVRKIRPRLGNQVAQWAISAIKEGNYSRTAELVLKYYDKTYRYGLEKRDRDLVFSLHVAEPIPATDLAKRIIEFAEQNSITGQRL